jgi:hypothetical protein
MSGCARIDRTNLLNFRACARRDFARVNGARMSGLPDMRIQNCRFRASPQSERLLLFDIVNVQNRTTLRATAPIFRDAQRERRPFVNFPTRP